MRVFASTDDVPWDDQRWPNFRPREFACRCRRHCAGEYAHDPAFLDALEALRTTVGKPLRITSGRRCAIHNARVGGAPLSMHVRAVAADIALTGHAPRELAAAAVRLGFSGIGYGRSFLHVDRRRRPASWFYPGSRRLWDSLIAQGGLPCPR